MRDSYVEYNPFKWKHFSRNHSLGNVLYVNSIDLQRFSYDFSRARPFCLSHNDHEVDSSICCGLRNDSKNFQTIQ